MIKCVYVGELQIDKVLLRYRKVWVMNDKDLWLFSFFSVNIALIII